MMTLKFDLANEGQAHIGAREFIELFRHDGVFSRRPAIEDSQAIKESIAALGPDNLVWPRIKGLVPREGEPLDMAPLFEELFKAFLEARINGNRNNESYLIEALTRLVGEACVSTGFVYLNENNQQAIEGGGSPPIVWQE